MLLLRKATLCVTEATNIHITCETMVARFGKQSHTFPGMMIAHHDTACRLAIPPAEQRWFLKRLDNSVVSCHMKVLETGGGQNPSQLCNVDKLEDCLCPSSFRKETPKIA